MGAILCLIPTIFMLSVMIGMCIHSGSLEPVYGIFFLLVTLGRDLDSLEEYLTRRTPEHKP